MMDNGYTGAISKSRNFIDLQT